MSEIIVNKMQQKFINSTNKNVLVSASAGSGKTTTMITKLTNLILGGVDIKKLLVLTFTDAASQSMKQKLYFALSKQISQFNKELKQNPTNKLIKTQIADLVYAIEDINFCDIGTFHSVFKKFITKYFYYLDIDPGFTLLDQEEHNILLNQAITNVLKKYIVSDDPVFYTLQETFNSKRNDSKFKEVIINTYYLSKEKIKFEEWFNNAIKQNFDMPFNHSKGVIYITNYFKTQLLNYQPQITKIIADCESYNLNSPQSYFSLYLGLFNGLKDSKNPQQILNAIFSFDQSEMLTFPRNLTAEQAEFKEGVKLTNDAFKKLLKTAKEKLITADQQFHTHSFETQKELVTKLYQVVRDVEEEFTKIKNHKSKLDFNDLQQNALKLIEIPEVVQELKNSYDYIFVDEFQDVNEVQFSIVNAIAQQTNLNMIGDVKQSIYEFRLASPQIFIDQLNTLDSNANGQVINLNQNYRSNDYILQFVNQIFSKLITTDTVGIDYKNSSMLECGNKDLQNFETNKGAPSVTFTLVNNSQPESEEEDAQTLSQKELEAQAVVKQISELLYKPFYNTVTGQPDTINYKHIAILTRDNSEFVKVLQDTLYKYKIPCYVTSKQNIFSTYEISVLFSFLKVLNNTQDDYSLTTVLLSKIVGLSYDDLSHIRLINNSKRVPFYECVNQYVGSKNADHVITQKLNSFITLLTTYRQLQQFVSVYDLTLKLINDFNLLHYFLSMPNGHIKQNNINEFLGLLNNQTYKFNLVGLLNYLTELAQKDDFRVSSVSGENAVTILTMHKSKGLEFPAVILAELGKQFNHNRATSDLVLSQNLGLGIKYKDVITRYQSHSLQYGAILLEKNESELKEQIRLLYVATTRAQNYLSLIGSYNAGKAPELYNKNPFECKSFIELILSSFGKLELGAIFNQKTEFTIFSGGSTCRGAVINSIDLPLVARNNFNKNLLPQVNQDLVNLVTKNLQFEYKTAKDIAVKNSVSSLLAEQDYVNTNYAPKSLSVQDLGEGTDTALLLGTATHKVMQQLNYTETLPQITKIINNLKTDSDFLTVANLINPEQIFSAMQTIKNLVNKDTIILREKQFLLSDQFNNLVNSSDITQNVIVQGVVDLILLQGECATVIDFKTNKTKSAQQLLNTYALQLNLYGVAVANAFALKQVNKYIYSFELGKLIEVK